MDAKHESYTFPGRGPLEYLQIAVRVAESHNGPAADNFNDEGFETVVPQVLHQIQHGWIDTFGTRLLESGMFRRGQPIHDELHRIIGGYTGVACHDQLNQTFFPGGGMGRNFVFKTDL